MVEEKLLSKAKIISILKNPWTYITLVLTVAIGGLITYGQTIISNQTTKCFTGKPYIAVVVGTFEAIRKDSHKLLKKLITSCPNDCNREDMRSTIINVKGSSSILHNYMFDKKGNNEKMPFKIYKLRNGQLSAYDYLVM